MPLQKLREFLDGNHVKYVTISHSVAYTAQEVAASAHIKGKELAKTVMVVVDGELGMAVVPASSQVDLQLLKGAASARDVRLASESEFKDRFPGCETGAMPPFGNLYGMKVYVAESLTQDKEIAFNAGTHSELIKLDYQDFERLAQPRVARITRAARAAG
jgi:Ala-tRNA(Pro) deacylase